MTDEYASFLTRAAAALAAAGGQLLLPADPNNAQAGFTGGIAGPPWARDWDQVRLLQSPSSLTVYAFTCAAGLPRDELQKRIDRLARGLAASGLLSGPPAHVVAVAVFPDGLERGEARAVTRLAPSTYFAGMRPATWAVDLRAGQPGTLWASSGLFSRPPGLQLLRQAVARPDGGPVDTAAIDTLASAHMERMQAFYGLMRERSPIVTYCLVAVNVLVFLVMAVSGGLPGGSLPESVLQQFGASSAHLVESGQWWRLFTLMFLHAGLAHILFNMVSLVVVGTLAERLWGSGKFLLIYLGSGCAASLTSFAHEVLTGQTDVLAVGASGAIFGVAGALMTIRFQRSDVIPEELRRNISSWMIPLVVLNLGLGLATQYIDNWAHIGGLVGGIILSFLLPLTRTAPAATTNREGDPEGHPEGARRPSVRTPQ